MNICKFIPAWYTNMTAKARNYLLQGNWKSKLSTRLRTFNNLFAHAPPRTANCSTCNYMLPRGPCVLALLQPSDHIKKQLWREISPSTVLNYQRLITQVMKWTVRFSPIMTRQPHIKTPSWQTPKALPYIPSYTAERHWTAEVVTRK